MADDAPKIIVDDDWKNQAQAEKAKLEEEARKEQEERQAHQLPEASFVTLVNQIAMQAVMALGGVEEPSSGKRILDLGLAKFQIDTLAVLKEKTKGNLNDEETKFIDTTINELQMAFVSMAKQAQAMMQQKAANAGAAAPAAADAASAAKPKIEI
ncbi:MAG TPA: DUF1844 domain-containing protein [Phycisphaerae bacterium]|nr:DUF1844 domain-containing protein [Phycisphaerae bacterium]HPS52959.1 DUF1844 domain-containing protein [Phycisphaerae bacterium]